MLGPVTVLMPVFNGAAYIAQQIESLLNQSAPPHRIILSDDGSTDHSVRIAEQVAANKTDLCVTPGPGQGYAANVRHLIHSTRPGFWAFCDQDDVWLPHGLERGLAALRSPKGPAIHVTQRIATDVNLNRQRVIAAPPPPSFTRALWRNHAPFNATLVNPAAAELIQNCCPPAKAMPTFPDWWIFALILGAGGTVIFDPQPGLLYRQHADNLFGSRNARGLIRRARSLISGSYLHQIAGNIRALQLNATVLTPANRHTLDRFEKRLAHFINSPDATKEVFNM